MHGLKWYAEKNSAFQKQLSDSFVYTINTNK